MNPNSLRKPRTAHARSKGARVAPSRIVNAPHGTRSSFPGDVSLELGAGAGDGEPTIARGFGRDADLVGPDDAAEPDLVEPDAVLVEPDAAMVGAELVPQPSCPVQCIE